MQDLLSDALIVLGLVVMPLGVYGMIRMPAIYTRLHAASKSVVLGLIAIATAAMLVSDMVGVLRLLLLSVLLLITTPMACDATGRAAWLHHERMQTPGAIDESDHHLADHTGPTWRL